MTVRKVLQNCVTFLVNLIYLLLVTSTLIGAIVILDTRIHNLSRAGVLMIDLLLIAMIVTYLFRKPILAGWHYIMANRYAKFCLTSIAIVLLVIWQISCVYYLTGMSGWDPGVLIAVPITEKAKFSLYLSAYPNNLFIVYLYHYFWVILGRPSQTIFAYSVTIVNLLLVDSGILLMFRTVKRVFDVKVAKIATIIYIVFFAVVPWFVFSYTDVPALFLCFLNLFVLTNIMQDKSLRLRDYCLAGALMAVSYLIKPSSIIIFIASFVIMIFYHQWKNHLLQGLVNFMAFVCVMAACVGLFHFQTQHYPVVKTDNNISFSMWHFVDMGLVGNGAFHGEDVSADLKIKSPQERRHHDIEVAKARLNKKGMFEYQKFLFNKHEKNSSDGSLGWGQEGNFLRSFMPSKKENSSIPGKIFTTNGNADRFHGGFEVISQMIWLLTIIGLLACLNSNDTIMVFSKMTIIGFFLFLLIFEGGRSRYLIQFLPVIIITASYGINKLTKIVYRRVH